MIRLLRPRQWTKNLLLFAALVFARQLFEPGAVVLATLGFIAFCLASSSVYVVNDLVDAEQDRRHPEKRFRPVASGAVTPARAGVLAVALTIAALSLSYAINPTFLTAVIVYIGMTHLYSFRGKNIVVLDILLVAFGFVIRAIAGALAIQVPISDWFILCTAFVALFLTVSKRKAELVALKGDASYTRPVLEKYTPTTLNSFIATTMSATLISYGLYVLDFQKHSGTDMRLLMCTFPVVVFGVFRYHHIAETSDLGGKPEEVILRDRPIQACAVLFLLIAVAALYLGT